MTELQNNLRNRAGKAFSWNLAGSLVKAVAGFSINIVLARMLGPEPFGLVAVALLVVSLGNLVVESGLSAGLVQKKELDDKDISFVFTLQMTLGVVLCLLLVILAPWLALFFGNPDVVTILRVLALMVFFQAFAQVPTALLKRQLAFKKIQQAQITSYLIAFLGLGLPLAYAGWGVWSLVIAQVVQSILNAVQLFFYAQHSLKPVRYWSRELAGFGGKVLLANIANWMINSLDSFFVGRIYGTVALGLYNRSLYLISTPTNILIGSIQPVLFSATSRLQEKKESFRKTYQNVFTLVAVVLIPAFVVLAIFSEQLIEVVYGSRWLEAAPILMPLALAMPLFALMAIQGPILNAFGKPGLEVRAQYLTVVVGLILFALFAGRSLITVAWCITGLYAFRLLTMTFITVKVLQVSWWSIFKPLMFAVILAVICGCLAYLPKVYLTQISSTTKLIFGFILALIAWLVLIYPHRKYGASIVMRKA